MYADYECLAPFSDEEFNENAEKIISDVLNSAEKFLPDLGYEQEVFVCITDDNEIKEINRENRNIDSATDVLSFPMLDHKEGMGEVSDPDINPDTKRLFLGDIIISKDHTESQAKEYGHSLKRELSFLVCHGYLHLRGFDHMVHEDEKLMMETAENILKGIAER